MCAAPYSQLLANPALNSVAAKSLDKGIKPRARPPVELALPAPDTEDQVHWLLSGSDPNLLLAVGKLHYWLVDLQLGEAIAVDFVSEHTLFAFLPDGRYVYRPGTVLIVRKPVPHALEDNRGDRVVVPKLGDSSQFLAFAPQDGQVISALQNFGNRSHPSRLVVSVARKPLSRSRGDMSWMLEHESQGWRSPVLNDGTLALHLQDGLHFITPGGTEASHLAISLLPELISADSLNRIWGFQPGEDNGVELVCVTTQGERFPGTPILGEPTQPPIPLSDGTVAVVTGLGVMVVEKEKLVWEKALPGGEQMMATGTNDLNLLVKGGDMLTLLKGSPHRIWSVRAPGGEPISSNPVVTSDGGVCFAAGLRIFQLER